MNKPAEKVKITRTRKRVYEMPLEEVPVIEVPIETMPPHVVVTAPVDPLPREEAAITAAEEPLPPTVTVSAPDSATPLLMADEETELSPHSPSPEASVLPVVGEMAPAQEENDETFRSAMSTVHTYSALSAATGLIPLPFVDMAGFMAMQLLMLKKLCELYNIPFDSQRSKSAIAILLSGINSAYLAASSSKLIPFIGAFTIAAMPAVNGALSYAVGRVFIQHFASGGTFLDFEPNKVRGYFEEQYRTGKNKHQEKV